MDKKLIEDLQADQEYLKGLGQSGKRTTCPVTKDSMVTTRPEHTDRCAENLGRAIEALKEAEDDEEESALKARHPMMLYWQNGLFRPRQPLVVVDEAGSPVKAADLQPGKAYAVRIGDTFATLVGK